MKKTAHQLLREAHQKLVQGGWIKGDEERNGAYCTIGALRAAGAHDNLEVLEALNEQLPRTTRIKNLTDPWLENQTPGYRAWVRADFIQSALIDNNDLPSRRGKEVKAMFCRAIQATKPKEKST